MIGWLAIGAAAAGLAGAARFHFWRPDAPGLPILMYHYLGDPPPGSRLGKLWVRRRDFVKQMNFLAAQGYQTARLDSLSDAFTTDGPPEKAVVVVFDDGGAETLDFARKVMAERGQIGAVMVVSSLAGGTNQWDRGKGEPPIELADWEQLRSLADAGWEIAAHTRTHADLTRLGDPELERELAGCRAEMESALGRPPTTVAYPYGLVDQRVKNAARAAGFQFGLVTRHGKNPAGADPMALKRLMVKRKDWLWDFRLKLAKGRSSF
jgi:peptidoglycan/xylan/chitin deacetylase (PgdA/CDA1 family)